MSSEIINIILGTFAVLTAVITIIVTIYFGIKQLQRREIVWSPVANSALLRIASGVKSNIEVKYQGHIIKNLQLVAIQIRNTGNQTIVNPSNFSDSGTCPIHIVFNNGAKVISDPNEIVGNHSKTLSISVRKDNDNRIVANSLFLHSKEWFNLEMIVADYSSYEVKFRTEKVPEIKMKPLSNERGGKLISLLYTFATVTLVLVLPAVQSQGLFGALLLGSLIVIILYALYTIQSILITNSEAKK